MINTISSGVKNVNIKLEEAFETIESDAKRWSNGPGYDITSGEYVGVSLCVNRARGRSRQAEETNGGGVAFESKW